MSLVTFSNAFWLIILLGHYNSSPLAYCQDTKSRLYNTHPVHSRRNALFLKNKNTATNKSTKKAQRKHHKKKLISTKKKKKRLGLLAIGVGVLIIFLCSVPDEATKSEFDEISSPVTLKNYQKSNITIQNHLSQKCALNSKENKKKRLCRHTIYERYVARR